ncbi:hydroxysqualene dehydroxylase [Amphibiibacter pelophylacis]|uniref:FAD-dependent oxidoreductase n=1 Tax=Amphibiibacter pelophylacis TaxID=1799477 RepID=A0ACC6P0C4_9BURK
MAGPRVAVMGAGWSGLAAAAQLQDGGAHVTLFDTSRTAGGRARSLAATTDDLQGDLRLDCGQHILTGACTQTLALMQRVGVRLDEALLRIPLTLRHASGQGGSAPDGPLARTLLRALPPGSDMALALALWRGWTLAERLALLRRLATWQRGGFALEADVPVARLCAGLPPAVVRDFIAPLALSALNTPLASASGRIFLHVLATTLRPDAAVPCGWRGSDLLLPRQPLDDLLPAPALQHLSRHGATLRLGERVTALLPTASPHVGWRLQTSKTLQSAEEVFDHVLLATPLRASATLLRELAPDWANAAQAVPHQPIITLYLRRTDASARAPLPWPAPLLALRDSANLADGRPAQFALDLQALHGQPLIALVVSAAAPWLMWMRSKGRDALAALLRHQLMAQAGHTFAPDVQRAPQQHLPVAALLCERRATPECRVGLRRPPAQVATAHGVLHLAGDALDSPWPGTLEGAVRSGQAAARATLDDLARLRPVRAGR